MELLFILALVVLIFGGSYLFARNKALPVTDTSTEVIESDFAALEAAVAPVEPEAAIEPLLLTEQVKPKRVRKPRGPKTDKTKTPRKPRAAKTK
jgi:hypothetical protein